MNLLASRPLPGWVSLLPPFRLADRTLPPLLTLVPCAQFQSPAALSALASKPSLHNPAWDNASAIARALARERGVAEAEHSLFIENLTRYIFNAYPDGMLESLAARDNALSRALLPPRARWLDKLDRDLEAPYSDAEVFAHLERLQSELGEAVAMLKDQRPAGGFTLTLMGGLMRGRLSARSDLDVILRSPDQDFFERVMKHPFGYLVKERLVILSPPPHNKRVRRALGPMLDIGDGAQALAEPGFLKKLFLEKRREFSELPHEREIPPEQLAVVMELKKLSKRALRYPPDDSRRREIEERMRQLSKQLLAEQREAP